MSTSSVTSRLTEAQGTFRPMVWLAAPVLAEQLLHLLVTLSDQVLTGHFLQTPHLAAIGTVGYLMWMLTVLFGFVAAGSTALTARLAGGGDMDGARLVTNQSLVIGVIGALPLTLFGLLARQWIATALQLEGEASLLAAEYLWYAFAALPMIMLETVGIACLRGIGDTRTGMWIMGTVNVVNIFVSWSLVQGWGPLPELGWEGIAIGTATGHYVGGIFTLVVLIARHEDLRLRLSLMRPHFETIRRILRIGVPGGVDQMSVVLCQLWFVSIINSLGNTAAAAHHVAIRIEAFAYLPATAFQVAAATLVGVYLGAQDPERAGRAVMTTCLSGLVFITVAGAGFFWLGEQIAGLIVSAEAGKIEVIALSASLLRIVAFAMPSLAIHSILCGSMRGAGDTRSPMWINWLGFLGLRIPLAYAVVYFGWWGSHDPMQLVVGTWYVMLLDMVFRSLLSVVRFFQGGWKRIAV